MMEDERFAIITGWFSLILEVGIVLNRPVRSVRIGFYRERLTEAPFSKANVPGKPPPFREKTYVPL